mgnify:CR=1 FL=1
MTITNLNRVKLGNRFAVTATVAFDSSYPTGGESLTAEELGLVSIDMLLAEAYATAHILKYDHANSKLMLYEIDTGAFAQEDNEEDMSAVSAKIFAIGI